MRANRVRHKYTVKPSVIPPTQESVHNDVGDLATDVVIMKNELSGVKADLASLASAFALFSDEYRKGKQWNWSLLTPLIGVGTVMMALLVLLVQNQISPLGSDVKSITTAVSLLNDRIKDGELHSRDQDTLIARSGEKDTGSEHDRLDLRTELVTLRGVANDNSAELKSLRAEYAKTSTEIETQVASVEQMRNELFSNLEWKLATLWPQVMKQPYPLVNGPRATIAVRPGSSP